MQYSAFKLSQLLCLFFRFFLNIFLLIEYSKKKWEKWLWSPSIKTLSESWKADYSSNLFKMMVIPGFIHGW